MRSTHFLRLLVITATAIAILSWLRPAPAQAQGENLLVNPGFEGPFSQFIPQTAEQKAACSAGVCTTANLAAGWNPWWVNQTAGDPDWKNRMPEYKPAEMPYADRIHGGARAQQYFTFGGTHVAGLWQQAAVPANARVRFSIWGMAWSTGASWDGPNSDVPYSAEPTVMNIRIGIDPTGGTNPFSPNIIWSPVVDTYDSYYQHSIEAQAQGTTVTVFTYSAPVEQRKHNDVYWDDAALTVLGAGQAVAQVGNSQPQNVPAPQPVFVLPPTATPDAEGVIYSTVGPGDSLWSMAAKAGISLDQILEYNKLTKDSFVLVGQTLITGLSTPTAPEPTAESAEASVAADTTPAPTNTPEAPTPTPVPVAGDICLTAYTDSNKNGLHDSGEPLVPAVAFTISNGQAVVSNYITDGQSEPYCIRGLEPGTYQITRSRMSREVLTSAGDWSVMLGAGGILNLTFGSYLDESAPAPVAVAVTDSAAAQTAQSDNPNGAVMDGEGASNTLLIAVVVAAVLLLIAVIVIILSRRSA